MAVCQNNQRAEVAWQDPGSGCADPLPTFSMLTYSYVTLCYAMLGYVVQCFVMLCNVMQQITLHLLTIAPSQQAAG